MAGLIPRDFIDDLLARTDIVELVDSRVRLKKAGRNYQACCPFHNEKTPSFTVSQDKQFYHCFGCGAHGNAISFLMEYDRLEFPDAIEELARYQGVEVPREQGGRQQPARSQAERDNDYQLMEQVARFFAGQFKHNPAAKQAIDYLKDRGLSGEVVKQFDMGYAPDSWDAVLSQFGRSPQQRQQLIDLKLANENDQGRVYDFFRHRVVFPIRDRRGRVVGFGGRVLDEGTPKYLNSPETRIFHKGQELYGFYQVRQAHRRLERVVVVEGYMDVVALAQFGIDYAVASLGTSTTPEHIQLLSRATSQIICCYDGDQAGRDAAWRALENALPQLRDGVEMRFLFLPDGEDPDSMVRQHGKAAFESDLDSAMPLSKFFFQHLLKQHNPATTEGKAALKAAATPLIQSIAGDNLRQLLEQELSRYTGEFSQQQLTADMAREQQRGRMRRQDDASPNKSRWTPVRVMLRLLLENPALANECEQVTPDVLAGFDVAGLDVLQQLHQHCRSHPSHNTAQIFEHFRDHPMANSLSRLLQLDLPMDETNMTKLYQDSFAKLLESYCEHRYEQLLSKSRLEPLTKAEKQELNELIKAI